MPQKVPCLIQTQLHSKESLNFSVEEKDKTTEPSRDLHCLQAAFWHLHWRQMLLRGFWLQLVQKLPASKVSALGEVFRCLQERC